MELLQTIFTAVSKNDKLHLVRYNTISRFSAACPYSLPLALHQLDVIRQNKCVHTVLYEARKIYDHCFVSRSPILLSLLRCEVLTIAYEGQTIP